jgi:hypothetical protein
MILGPEDKEAWENFDAIILDAHPKNQPWP